MEDFLRAAQALASDPEAISISEEFLPLENEALDLAEGEDLLGAPASLPAD